MNFRKEQSKEEFAEYRSKYHAKTVERKMAEAVLTGSSRLELTTTDLEEIAKAALAAYERFKSETGFLSGSRVKLPSVRVRKKVILAACAARGVLEEVILASGDPNSAKAQILADKLAAFDDEQRKDLVEILRPVFPELNYQVGAGFLKIPLKKGRKEE